MLHEPPVVRHAHEPEVLEVRERQPARLLREEAAEAEDRRLGHGGAGRRPRAACVRLHRCVLRTDAGLAAGPAQVHSSCRWRAAQRRAKLQGGQR